MDFKDILRIADIDPDAKDNVVLIRHRPFEPNLAKVMPWLISERPELFEAYHSVPGRPEKALSRARYLASFLGLRPGTAHFVGLYRIGESRNLDLDAFWAIPENQSLRGFGYEGFTAQWAAKVNTVRQFSFEPLEAYANWSGKLVIDFPPPERSWFRLLDRGTFPVRSILEESAFSAAPPDWHEIDLNVAQLAVLPASWRTRLSEWRGIYLIFDERDGKSYVGSAYGHDNLLGRWLTYARDGHGGNRELRDRDPQNFRFTILERLAPDLSAEEVISRENSWKSRLHTRAPFGLNAN